MRGRVARRLVHGMGFRFRLHVPDLPGMPDIVLQRLRKIINVHGCFWHLHACQRRRKDPVTRATYWRRKREGNAARDRRNVRRLRRAGWAVLTIWECQTRDPEALKTRLARFLRS